MYKNDLIQTLKLLDQEEMEVLHMMVSSPMFNEVHRHWDKIRLFEHLKKHHPEFTHEDIGRVRCAALLWPDREKSLSELDRCIAELMPIVRQFITFKQFDVRGIRSSSRKDPALSENPARLMNYLRQQLALLRFYSQRLSPGISGSMGAIHHEQESDAKGRQNFVQNLYQHISTFFSVSDDFTHFDERSFSDFYHYHYWVELEMAHWQSSQNNAGDTNLLNTIERLDEFYLLSKLDLMCRLAVRNQLYRLFSDQPDLQQRMENNFKITQQMVHSLLHECKKLRTPGITVYATLLDFLTATRSQAETDHAAERFGRLIRFSSHRKAIPEQRMSSIYVLLRNYWIKRFNTTRDLRFLMKSHALQHNQFEQLRPDEKVHNSHFRNFVNTAVKLGDYDTAEHWLKTFDKKRLYGEHATDTLYDILWANLYFAKQEYQAAANRMPHYYEYGRLDEEISMAIAASLDTRIHFELGMLDDPDYAANMLKANKIRIERFRQISTQQGEPFLLFLRYAEKIFTLPQNRKVKKDDLPRIKTALKTEIEQSKTADKEWLLEKLSV